MRQSWKIPTNGIQRRPSLSNELSVLSVSTPIAKAFPSQYCVCLLQHRVKLINGSRLDKKNKVALGLSDDSDQQGQQPKLIRVFILRLKGSFSLCE